MHKSRRVLVLPAIVLTAASTLLLSGCALGQIHDATQKLKEIAHKASELPQLESSSAGKGTAALSYSGAQSGTVTAGAVLCTVHDGKIVQFAAPTDDDPNYDSAQSVVSSLWDTDHWVVTLSTNPTSDSPTPFIKIGADGVTTQKKDGRWTITLAGTELTGFVGTDVVTTSLSGTITCGEITKF